MPATQTAPAAKTPASLSPIYTGQDFRVHTHLTTPAILAARLIVKGDVSQARAEVAAHHVYKAGFTVAEVRALNGACMEANRRYGCDIKWTSFLAA